MPTPPGVLDLGDGVFAVDTGFQRPFYDAAYLLVRGGRVAFIDSGTQHCVPRLLQALDALGLARDAVDWVIPTHVHLDHAGGVGGLMAALPRATCLVHPRGLRHLVDPSALIAGARAVYGDAELERHYGTPLPVPASRARASHDGLCITLGGATLQLIDTPGHARHHHCIWDEATRTWFAGDTFGVSYRECDGPTGAWALPTTSPVQFDPPALVASVQRLIDAAPERICITHYGALTSAAALQRIGASLQDDIRRCAALGLSLRDAPDRDDRLRDGMAQLLRGSARRHGVPLADDALDALLATDVALNASGVAAWLDAPQPAR